MKQKDRIVVPCTGAFKERFKQALVVEASRRSCVQDQADKVRELVEVYCNKILLPANHPRNG